MQKGSKQIMPALLTSIIFDQSTEDYVCGELVAKGPVDEEVGFDLLDCYRVLSPAFKLNGLPSGHYTLIVSADIHNDANAKLTLINAETSQTIQSFELDLQPLMASAVQYRDDYGHVMQKFEEASGKNAEDICDREVFEINKVRSVSLKNLLEPYIKNNERFGNDLLEFLDLLTTYFIEDRLIEAQNETVPANVEAHRYVLQNPIIH